MLGQDRHDGSDFTSRPASKRQSRRPTKFMFIESSNDGVNAKPDRVLKSFVMKSARNKKTWSTRPKSPKEENLVVERPRKQVPDHIDGQQDPTFSAGQWMSQDHRKDSVWDNHSLASPPSSRSGSIFSTYNSSRTCDSPLSSHTSPFVEHTYPEHAYNSPFRQPAALTFRDVFDINFLKPFDCLSVRLDAHTQRLLHQCEQSPFPYLAIADAAFKSSKVQHHGSYLWIPIKLRLLLPQIGLPDAFKVRTVQPTYMRLSQRPHELLDLLQTPTNGEQ